MTFMVTQASSVMMSSPSPIIWVQDLHETWTDAAFLGYQIKAVTKLSSGFCGWGPTRKTVYLPFVWQNNKMLIIVSDLRLGH